MILFRIKVNTQTCHLMVQLPGTQSIDYYLKDLITLYIY